MSVNSTDAFSGPYVATGVAQEFPFTFNAASRDEVQVTADGLIVDPTSFFVTLNDDGTGTVTATIPAGATVFVESNPDFQQSAQFSRFAPYFPDAVNIPLDRAAIRDIVLRDRLDRTFVIPRRFQDAAGKFARISADGLWELVDGVPGLAGPAAAFRANLAALKAAAITDGQSVYDRSLWIWTLGNYTGQVDDVNVVASNSTSAAVGAWVRQDATGISFAQPATGAIRRPSGDKLGEVISWADFGISEANSAAVNTPRFHAMWNFAAGRLCTIGEGTFRYEGSYAGPVNMRGARMPTINTAGTALENGTRLVGYTNFSGDTVILRDMGVDHGSAAFSTGFDALKISAAAYNSGRLAVLQNVAALGRNDTDAFHAVLVEGYGRVFLNNVVGSTNQYCFAIKSRNVMFQGLHAIGGQNGIIFKSDGSGAGTGSLANVAGSGIVINGTANTVYGVRVLADNQSISNLAVSNVNISDVDYGVVVEAATGVAISEVQFSNVNGRNIRKFGIQTGGAGALYEAQFNGFNLVDLGDYAAQFQTGSIKLRNFYGSMKAGATAHAASFMRAEATLTDFSVDNMALVENYGAGASKPALLLNLNPLLTQLAGEMRYAVEGNVPEPGLNAQSPSGTTAALVLRPDLIGGRSTCIVTLTANTTVTSIAQVMPGTATIYPRGYVVTIMNASVSTLTLANNANIRPRAEADLTLGINKTATFIWLGSSWHQVN